VNDKFSVGVLGLLTTCIACAVALAAQEKRFTYPESPIDAARLAAHVKMLASDAFEGRAPATSGEIETVDYITKQLAAAGVKPGGDPDGKGGRRWTQDVPLIQSDIQGTVTASVRFSDVTRTLHQGNEVAIRSTFLPTTHVSIASASMVFVGYGVTAPERNWDDFKGTDLRGKIAVVLVNDPDFEADLRGRFDGKAMTYYGRWTYKFEEAARRGALGMLVIHETAPASYGWETVKNSNTATMFDIVRQVPADTHLLLEGWIQRDVAVDLFRRVGLDFEAQKRQAQTPSFKPIPLGNATFSADYSVKRAQVVSKNVIGLLEGHSQSDETVIYTAHWDHLGIGVPDATGDRIYNGARDNALGVAALLELARVYAAAPRTARSVTFLSVTAEEKGLLGSEYYAQHPLYPLATTAAVYNVDGGSEAPSWDVAVAGEGKISLQDDLAGAAMRQGRHLSPDPRPEAGSFFRSDHFSFAKVGVPAISFRAGLDRVEGGIAAGKTASDDYIAKRYHQPSDEWSESWDLRGEVIDIGLLFTIGREIADSRVWPAWKDGSEFKATRDKTSSSRR
jgi:Zn-dependent M28 family amino/carboxypeptidase